MSDISQPFPHNLEEGELRDIALIILNWGTAEFIVGEALTKAYGLEQSVAKTLIHPLDMERKILQLAALLKDGKLPDEAKPFVDGLQFAQKNFRRNRNVFSHCIVLTGEDKSRRAVTGRFQETDPDELPLILNQSKYVGVLAKYLMFAMMGTKTFPPLPEKPLGPHPKS